MVPTQASSETQMVTDYQWYHGFLPVKNLVQICRSQKYLMSWPIFFFVHLTFEASVCHHSIRSSSSEKTNLFHWQTSQHTGTWCCATKASFFFLFRKVLRLWVMLWNGWRSLLRKAGKEQLTWHRSTVLLRRVPTNGGVFHAPQCCLPWKLIR